VQVVEEFRRLATADVLTKEVLPIVGGLLAIDYAGDRVGRWLQETLKFDPKWTATAADLAIGAGILALTGWMLPEEWKNAGRRAGYTGFALAVMDGLKAAGVLGGGGHHSSQQSTTTEEVKKYL